MVAIILWSVFVFIGLGAVVIWICDEIRCKGVGDDR